MNPRSRDAAAPTLAAARGLAAGNQPTAAEQAYARVLEIEPDHPEALHFLGLGALRRNDRRRAVEMLQQAACAAPRDPVILKDLGIAYLSDGRLPEAVSTLRRALDVSADAFVARLYLGNALERLGDIRGALVSYLRAIKTAQLQGRWLNDSTTPPGLRENLKHAMRYVDERRRALFAEAFEPLRTRYGSAALGRVERALTMHLGDIPQERPDPRQRPKYFYFPDLPAHPYFERRQFPYLAELEARFEAIRDEAAGVLSAGNALEPFLKLSSPAQQEQFLHGSAGPPAWDAFFFYRHSEAHQQNCRACPHTAASLESLPLVRIRAHAPEICFSVLTPGTTILPHHGVTNTRLVAHLPLIIPEDCALRVGGESRAWHERQCLIFDDTYEHEAWNRSSHLRVVLILDVWNPHLTEPERVAVAELVATIGDLNRESKADGTP